MKKKRFSRAAAFLMLISLTADISSCSGEAKLTGDGSVDSATTSDIAASIDDIPSKQPYLPKNDYNGSSFCILAPVWGLYKNYFFADEENGDVMNDAIVKREKLTEEYLNVDIKHRLEGTIVDEMERVRTAAASGDDPWRKIITG